MSIKAKPTRFRAYKLGTAGSSFSYFDGTYFTLIEARHNEQNEVSIDSEMRLCDTTNMAALHITSWDQDHCSPSQLETIIERYKPFKIEYPGYHPHTDCGKESLKIIEAYKQTEKGPKKFVQVTPRYINGLKQAKKYGYNDIFYHPRKIDPDSANNNSSVKQFRSGSFNVLSLGDVESTNIAAGLRRQRSVASEADVMILAHHGADNGFTTSSFLKHTRPTIAVASADYGNQFQHPRQEIRDLLHKNRIKLFTTKTGDVAIFSTGTHVGRFRVVNLRADNSEVSSQYDFVAKKHKILSSNSDTLNARRLRRNWPRR